MILTPHILSGAAVASQISNPFAMVIAAMAVHHILDMIPHWDYEIHSSRRRAAQKIALDIAIAGIITLFFIWNLPLEKQFHILLGGFFGVLPDGEGKIRIRPYFWRTFRRQRFKGDSHLRQQHSPPRRG